MPLPEGVNEMGFTGALTESAVEVTQCEMNDILVPTEVKIVFKGVASNTETASEGLMAEYHGHIFGESRQCPIFEVKTITYRNDPIIPICITERTPEKIETDEDSCKRLNSLQSAKTQFCNKVGHVAFASKPGFYIPTIYLMGDDIDPTNLKDVIWAAATRCQQRANNFVFGECHASF
ncbi:uncharacterized protein NECHADRAFT_81268 [Fusarium vanettenii 77-13-4]|uniref:Uncharacterized protein n=1 Tax=Fusarium vanettenii (strain ATCC MYA-4622 / CBS 123669 / FGSC 9596 / NRRL 45880 / 77-13-4) TaxID=660122 RepID=C7ZHJ7_FUSV7|nr:uncharacterized protein NECHADRAFT_81268 [Fusarium vanettenii 77-13-4]EEU36480.1 hypothetical protein NECHADRAFT_81268 [Fusarium vanettenii 77-13-4]